MPRAVLVVPVVAVVGTVAVMAVGTVADMVAGVVPARAVAITGSRASWCFSQDCKELSTTCFLVSSKPGSENRWHIKRGVYSCFDRYHCG